MDTQVIVVGAGPAGLMLAGELALGGAAVTVLERRPGPSTQSRASTVHARTMEIFDERGLLPAFGDPPHHTTGHFGGIPLDFGALPTLYPGLWSIPQPTIERVLAEWATGLGAIVRHGNDVVELCDTGEVVRVLIDTPAGPRRITAGFVVGCDGEDSTVRRCAGIALRGAPATRRLLRGDVTGVEVAQRRFERLPGGLAIAGRLPSGATRLMVGEHGAQPGGGREPAFEEFSASWKRVTGEDITRGVPLWINAFEDACLQAEQYQRGRVLLAGDAAHVQMPSGGQAINLALQDSFNLGWKLAAEVTGRSCGRLLATYHLERYEVGRRVLQNVAAQSALLLGAEMAPVRSFMTFLVGRAEVRDLLAAAISGLDVRYGAAGNPMVGARLPFIGAAVASEVAAGLRGGKGLMLDLTTDDVRCSRLGRLVADQSLPVPVLVNPSLAAHLPSEVQAVVVRPDGHVSWIGAADSDPVPALREWLV